MPKKTSEQKALEGFYEFCLSTCSPQRLKKVQATMVRSRKMIGKDLTKLKVDNVVRFLSVLNQSNFKDWTKNDYKKIFKRFLKWHYKDLEMVEGSKVKEGFKVVSKKRAFNKEKINKNTLLKKQELSKLVRHAPNLKWKAIISFAYESAFRPCEIKSLKWKDLKFDDSKGICRVWVLSPKTGDSREVPVKDCVIHLKRWREDYPFPDRNDQDYVFPSQHDKSKPMGDGGLIREMLRRISAKAGLRHINPYLLRHSRIYEIQKRLPEKIAAKFAGHSIETSEIYNHLDNDDVEESMLKEIYATKEITAQNEPEIFKRIEDLEKQIAKLQKAK